MTRIPSSTRTLGLALGLAVALGLASLSSHTAPTQAAPSAAGPKVRTLTQQEVFDILLGSSIQATRASNTQQMIDRAKELFAQGKTFTMIDPQDLPDDWMVVAAAGGVGGGGAWPHVIERTKQQHLPLIEDSRLASAKALSAHIGKPFKAIIRNEAGGAMIAAFETAIAMNVPLVDACLAGRTKPEVSMQVSHIAGEPGYPAAMVTRWGDTVIIAKAVDDYRLEDLARAVAVASGGGSSIARNPMTGAQIKRASLVGNISDAMRLGRTAREAREQGRDPIAALVKATGGYKLFQGVVTKSDHRGDRGFAWEEAELEGVGAYKGHTYKVWVKNENIISWLDGQPDVVTPDLLYNLDPKTGDAIVAPRLGGYPMGMEVAFIGRAAPSFWRTPKGIEMFGPKHFGFDLPFVPIEERMKTRPGFGN